MNSSEFKRLMFFILWCFILNILASFAFHIIISCKIKELKKEAEPTLAEPPWEPVPRKKANENSNTEQFI